MVPARLDSPDHRDTAFTIPVDGGSVDWSHSTIADGRSSEFLQEATNLRPTRDSGRRKPAGTTSMAGSTTRGRQPLDRIDPGWQGHVHPGELNTGLDPLPLHSAASRRKRHF